MMTFNMLELEEGLGRKLSEKERKNILEYAVWTQQPKPSKDDPKYEDFMKCRYNVFSLYKQLAVKFGADTTSIDKILDEYQPKS